MSYLTELSIDGQNELFEHIIDYIEESQRYPSQIEGSELHHLIFNQDYYLIGRYQAEQWLQKHFGSVFTGIGIVQEYEKDVFGQTQTELDEPESIVNMLTYLLGEEMLAESNHLQDSLDSPLTSLDLEIIKQELNGAFNPNPQYTFALTYQIMTEESAEHGDYEDQGFEIEKSEPFDSLVELLDDRDIQNQSWLEFSSFPVDPTSPVVSDVDDGTREYFEKGIHKSFNLHINRIDEKPLSRFEMELIHDHLGLMDRFKFQG